MNLESYRKNEADQLPFLYVIKSHMSMKNRCIKNDVL